MGSDVKWIRLTTDMFDDEKVKLIEAMPDADTVLIVWVKLLCQAGKTNASGYLYLSSNIPYTDEMLSTIFNRPLNNVRFALETLERLGMIGKDGNGIYIANWEKHQNIEGLERIKEQTRQRVAKHRAQKKLKECNVTETLRNAPEVELELDQEEEKEKRGKSKRFTPPTINEITTYCKERNNDVDPERFHDFYQSKNWMIGKNKMKDWKAAVRTWERGNKQKQHPEHNYL